MQQRFVSSGKRRYTNADIIIIIIIWSISWPRGEKLNEQIQCCILVAIYMHVLLCNYYFVYFVCFLNILVV